jgi:alpha,alpha-trehalose phosphorylase
VRLRVKISTDTVTYDVHDGPHAALTIFHAGEKLVVKAGSPVTRMLLPRKALLAPPTQPAGREPLAAFSRISAAQHD